MDASLNDLFKYIFQDSSSLYSIIQQQKTNDLDLIISNLYFSCQDEIKPYQGTLNLIRTLSQLDIDRVYEKIQFLYSDQITTLEQLLALDEETLKQYEIPYDKLMQINEFDSELLQVLSYWNINNREQIEQLRRQQICNLSQFLSLNMTEVKKLKIDMQVYLQIKKKCQQQSIIQAPQQQIKTRQNRSESQVSPTKPQISQKLRSKELDQSHTISELDSLFPFYECIKLVNDLAVYQYPLYQQHDLQIDKGLKTMIVLGQTGSGKTTLINFFINYHLGVQFNDPFRFTLIREDLQHGTQSVSQTQDVKIYYIKPFGDKPALRIIDTPGFGDTRGILQDQAIAKKIEHCFRENVDSLTTICFVMQASNVRLTANQNYILSCMTQMFGNDVIRNFLFMFTFCDGGQPQAREAITFKGNSEHQASHVAPYIDQIQKPWYLQFNSSAYLSTNKGTQQETYMTNIFWDMGMKSFELFVEKKLKLTSDVSLTLTQEVIKYREQLMNCIGQLRPKIVQLLTMIESCRQLSIQLQDINTSMFASSKYKVLTTKIRINKIDLKQGEYVTNCIICNHTCHYPCYIPEDCDKMNCAAMRDGKCVICQNKCQWSQHSNAQFRIVPETYQEEIELQELKVKYQKETSNKSAKEQVLEGIAEEYIQLQTQCIEDQGKLKNYIDKLNQTALQPAICKSQVEYIDIMIQEEESRRDDGYSDRIKVLQDMKATWVLIEQTYTNDGQVKITSEFVATTLQKRGNEGGLFASLTNWFKKSSK